MDQKNSTANGDAPHDATTNTGQSPESYSTPTNEVSVDLASLEQAATEAANDANAKAAAADAQAAGEDARDVSFEGTPSEGVSSEPGSVTNPVAPDSPTVAFTTDSSGNVQTVDQEDSSKSPVASSEVPAPDEFGLPNEPVTRSVAEPGTSADAVPQIVPTPGTVSMPVQPTAEPSTVDQTSPVDTVPASAPVPVSPTKDKKLLIVLAVVAVLLIGAIVAMMFV